MVEQKYLDYPCPIEKKLRMFIFTCTDPIREYVCTSCPCPIGYGKMDEWQRVRRKLEERGIRLVIGMSLIYPFREEEQNENN